MLLSQHTEDKIEAGTDEAGRGCLAGPVVAAAVILPKSFSHPFLRDSKKLTSIQRLELEQFILPIGILSIYFITNWNPIQSIYFQLESVLC